MLFLLSAIFFSINFKKKNLLGLPPECQNTSDPDQAQILFQPFIINLMKDTNMIDSCQAHMAVQYTSNIEFMRQK